MTEKINKEAQKEEKKEVTNKERITALRQQQDQLKETFIKVQGAIEMLEALEKEAE